jgi:hypothetical protein
VLIATIRSNEDQHKDVPDPSGLPPVCDEEEFTELLAEMVADEAPRLFAIVAEYGDRVDAGCAAWGLAFADHAFAVSVHSNRFHSAPTPEALLCRFRVSAHVTPRLVWFDSSKAGSLGSEDVTAGHV